MNGTQQTAEPPPGDGRRKLIYWAWGLALLAGAAAALATVRWDGAWPLILVALVLTWALGLATWRQLDRTTAPAEPPHSPIALPAAPPVPLAPGVERPAAAASADRLAELAENMPGAAAVLWLEHPDDSTSLVVRFANSAAAAHLDLRVDGHPFGPQADPHSPLMELDGLDQQLADVVRHRVPTHAAVRGPEGDTLGLRAIAIGDNCLSLTAEETFEGAALAESMRTLALHDQLTGLPNRALVLDRIEAALARARRTGEPVSIMMVDLNHFKEVNDSLGHDQGDHVLVELARRYTADLRDCDTVGRIGGDEFVVVLTTGATVAGTRGVADRIVRLTEEAIAIDGVAVTVGASVGASRHPDHGADAAELLRRADSAMYRAKRSGVSVTFFSSELELIELRHVELRSALLAEEWVDELRMTYRPRIDLRTMLPNGVEASAVWEHPRHGPVQLDDLAEIGGPADHLARLARAVTEQAAAELTAIGWPDDLSVNVDMSSLPWLDSSIDEWVPELIEKYHLREGQLRLQITQSQVVERAGLSVAALDSLRDQGVRFTLGGFGSLESSLSALRELPVNEILIHRRLIHELELGDPTIVRTVIDLAHRLGLTAVADGIDTVEVLDRVRMLDCDSALGAMAGIPLDVDGLEAFVLAMTPAKAAVEIPLPD